MCCIKLMMSCMGHQGAASTKRLLYLRGLRFYKWKKKYFHIYIYLFFFFKNNFEFDWRIAFSFDVGIDWCSFASCPWYPVSVTAILCKILRYLRMLIIWTCYALFCVSPICISRIIYPCFCIFVYLQVDWSISSEMGGIVRECICMGF